MHRRARLRRVGFIGGTPGPMTGRSSTGRFIERAASRVALVADASHRGRVRNGTDMGTNWTNGRTCYRRRAKMQIGRAGGTVAAGESR